MDTKIVKSVIPIASSLKRKREFDRGNTYSRKKMTTTTDESLYNLVRCNATVGMDNIRSPLTERQLTSVNSFQSTDRVIKPAYPEGAKQQKVNSSVGHEGVFERSHYSRPENLQSSLVKSYSTVKLAEQTSSSSNVVTETKADDKFEKTKSRPLQTPTVKIHATIGLLEKSPISTNHITSSVTEPESRNHQRPRRTLLDSAKKPYIKTNPRLPKHKNWTVTKIKARKEPSDKIVVAWQVEMTSALPSLTTKEDEMETREVLMKSRVFKRMMPYEQLQKLNEAVQKWNRCFGTFYSIL